MLPLFRGADMESGESFPELVSGSALLLEIEPEAGVALRIDDRGLASFHDLATGEALAAEVLRAPSGASLTAIAEDSTGGGRFAAGFADGSALIAEWTAISGPAAGAAGPRLVFPFGGANLSIARR